MSHFTTNPDAALLLIILGSLGICAEFLRPGAIIPGVLGSLLTLTGFAGLSPVDWRGALLMTLAFPLFWADARYSARGVLTAIGTALLPLGVIVLQPRVHPAVALLTVPPGLVMSFLLSVAVLSRSRKALL